MFLKLQKQNKYYVIFLAIFCSAFLFFTDVNFSYAKSCTCDENQTYEISFFSNCDDFCVGKNFDGSTSTFFEGLLDTNGSKEAVSASKASSPNEDVCNDSDWWSGNFINCLLLGILRFVGFLLSAANTLFEWCVNSDNWSVILKNEAIYRSWEVMRDLLNISFIIVLLYSAFNIIFQVDSEGFKKRLLTIFLMAILVNFSFPITLFIIDISNSLMYTIINTLNFGNTAGSGASGSMGLITRNSGIQAIIKPEGIPTVPEILTTIVFVFILTVTILAIGILLVIRMVTLAILLIFSPIAFVARILPETKGFSSKWWDQLLSNALFGPAIMLGIYVATNIMNNQSGLKTLVSAAAKQTDGASLGSDVIASMAFFSIPIIILWTVIGYARGSSIAGASMIVGQAQKFAQGAGKKLSGYNWGKANYDSYAAERKKRSDEKNKDRRGGKIGKGLNNIQDRVHGALPIPGSEKAKERYKDRKEASNKAKIKDEAEKHDGVDIESLVNDAHAAITTPPPDNDKSGKIEAAGKIKHMMGRKEFDKELESRIKNRSLPLLNPAGPPRPIDIPIRPITDTMRPGEIAQIRNDEATNKREMDKYVQAQKEWFYAQARIAIKNGETA